MPTPFTRFLDKAGGYDRHDEQQITFDEAGCEALRTTIDIMRERNHKQPRACNFAQSEGEANTKANWRSAGALAIEYFVDDDLAADTIQLRDAAGQLGFANFILDTCARDYRRTLTLAICLAKPIKNSDDYGRLVYVMIDRLKALGLKLKVDPSSGAMTHLFHLHAFSAVGFFPGTLPCPRALIKQSEGEAKNRDLKRFDTIGARAAEAQLSQPTLTSSDNLFEWPAS